MTYLAASIFFTLVLLGSLVAIHLTVRAHWVAIVTALRGDLGVSHAPVRTASLPRPHAAA